jgi:tRNA threonylcarbamoyladenosine biosynthesis protein TsaE
VPGGTGAAEVPATAGVPATAEVAEVAEVRVPSGAQMRDLGRRLAGLLGPGDLVVLTGPLGAGKTTLVQGIGLGLGVRGPVTSPTFVIARVHPSLRGGPALVHADAYRLGSRAEVDDLDLDADLDSSVTVVEWGEGLVEDLSASYLEIKITVMRQSAPPGLPGGPWSPGTNGANAVNGPDGTDASDGGMEAPEGAEAPDGEMEAPEGAEAPDGGTEAHDGAEAPDELRVVRLTGTGARWAAAARSARRTLADWPGGSPDQASVRL